MEKAFINMFMGMGVVFAVLILISLIITCFKFFPYFEDKLKQKKKIQTQNELNQFLQQDIDTVNEPIKPNFELISVIMAAIANQENCSTQDFVVKSIKRR